MSEKATATAAPEKTSSRGQPTKANGGLSSRLVADNPFFGLQQNIGNQATLRLLDGAVIQTKLRVSQPGDADEQEADRIAEQVVSSRRAPTIHRKCACSGGTPCAKCASEEEETIPRSVELPSLHSSELTIHRAPAEGASPAKTHHHGTHPLVVEDDAKDVEPHQMRKSQFIALLRTDACATADAVLMSVGHTTKGCPYIAKWLSFYEKQNSHHIEAAMQKYAPETARAHSAHEAIRLLTMRIQKAATTWAKTGKVEGLPPEMASQIKAGKSLLEKAHDFATTGVAGAIFGFIGGKGKKEEDTAAGGVMRKAASAESAPAHDAASVRSQLGTGHSLDSRVQSQMSSAFGYDFSGVRVHTDSNAATLSSNLQARAFTIGSDVAFASNEYRPGTLVGDALIAHELAHVVQQGRGNSLSIPQRKAEGDDTSLESDADQAAAGAVSSIWRHSLRRLSGFRDRVTPSLRSGLSLRRCNQNQSPSTLPKVNVGNFRTSGSTADSGEDNCALCPQDLGIRATNGQNFMELRGEITGHQPGAQYDFKRTKERGTWKKVGATWTQVSHVGPGEDDDHTDDDESLTPVNNHIYSIDGPGYNTLSDPVGDAAATEEVYKSTFVESVNVKVGSGSWTKSSNDFLWHSITWLEKVAGAWRRKAGKNEISSGSTSVGTGDP